MKRTRTTLLREFIIARQQAVTYTYIKAKMIAAACVEDWRVRDGYLRCLKHTSVQQFVNIDLSDNELMDYWTFLNAVRYLHANEFIKWKQTSGQHWIKKLG